MASITPKPQSSDDTRFIPNKVERTWIIQTLIAYGAPVQKLKTLDNTCARVAQDACTRNVTDAAIGRDQTLYGMSWRREYMPSRTKKHNVVYINSTVMKLARTVPVSGPDPYDPAGPLCAGVRDGGKENDAQHLLYQAMLDYKHASDSRTQTTEEDAAKTVQRQKESRREKRQRLERQKQAYAERKKQQVEEKNARQRERRASDVQNLKAQTMSANAAAANVAIQRKQCEQFGLFLAMYASKNSFPLPQITTELPPALPSETLETDPALLKDPTPAATISTDARNSSAAQSTSPSQNRQASVVLASEIGESDEGENDDVAPQAPTDN